MYNQTVCTLQFVPVLKNRKRPHKLLEHMQRQYSIWHETETVFCDHAEYPGNNFQHSLPQTFLSISKHRHPWAPLRRLVVRRWLRRNHPRRCPQNWRLCKQSEKYLNVGWGRPQINCTWCVSLFKIALGQQSPLVLVVGTGTVPAQREQRAETEECQQQQQHASHVTEPQIVGIQHQGHAHGDIYGRRSPTAQQVGEAPAVQAGPASSLVIIAANSKNKEQVEKKKKRT